MKLNSMVFRAINGLALHNAVLDKLMIFMSEYAPDIFMVVLAAVYIIGLVKKDSKLRAVAVDTFLITAICLFIGYVLGVIWYVPRPFVNNKVNLLLPHIVDASFPSDHAIGTMSIALGINKFSKTYGRLFVVLSILVGISRVYVGHHYLTDVLGGYIIVLAIIILYERLLKKKIQAIYFSAEKLIARSFPVLERFI